MEVKPVHFIGSSRDDLREFPSDVRKALGEELLRVQNGLMPVDFKPMKEVGKGAYEIRVHLDGAWRVIYVAKFANAVYVLHAFEKKTQKTSQNDIELAKQRYKLIGG
jgi:phage-related protein